MGITPLFTPAEVHKMMQHSIKTVDDAIFNTLSYLGERCVNEARDFGSYQDQTSNLRSSCGYIILANGQLMHSDFRKAGKGIDGGEGIEAARSFAMSMAGDYPKGYVLIVVAGMNYAAYVEAKGYNVLSSAENLAKIQLPRMLAQLKAKIEA